VPIGLAVKVLSISEASRRGSSGCETAEQRIRYSPPAPRRPSRQNFTEPYSSADVLHMVRPSIVWGLNRAGWRLDRAIRECGRAVLVEVPWANGMCRSQPG
jgi:hypothetical protein